MNLSSGVTFSIRQCEESKRGEVLPDSPSPQPSPPRRGGTSAAAWWRAWTLATPIPFCEQVSACDESRRTSESRRGSPSRTGRDRSSLSPGERVGVRTNRKRFLPPAVAAEFPKSSGHEARGPSKQSPRTEDNLSRNDSVGRRTVAPQILAKAEA